METKIDWFGWLKSLPTKCCNCNEALPQRKIPEDAKEEEYAKFLKVGDPKIVSRQAICYKCMDVVEEKHFGKGDINED